MADDGFQFELGLEDAISGPAAAEARALKGLSKEIGEADKHLRALLVTQRQMASRGVQVDSVFSGAIKGARAELAALKRAQADLKPVEKGGLFADLVGANLFASALRGVGSALMHVGREAIRAYGQVRMFVLESAELRDASILEFGGGKAGEDLFGRVQQRSSETHLRSDEAEKFARDLKMQGLEDADLIVASVQSRAELVRTGQLRGAEKLTSIIEKSLASGHFDPGKGLVGKGGAAGSGRALAGLGVHLPDLFADLARRYKTDIPHVKEMLKEGKVETEVGIAALDEAVSKGDVGKAARQLFTLTDFKTDVFNAFTRAAQNVDLSKFNKALVDVDVSITNLARKGGPAETFFQMIVDGTAKAGESVSAFVDDFQIAILSVENMAKETRNWIVDHGLGFVIGKQRGDNGGIEDRSGKKGDFGFSGGPGTIGYAAAAEAGLDLGDGVSSGIDDGADAVAKSAADMGVAAEKSLRDKTQTHSPSEMFADVGYDMASGVAQGWSAAGIEASIANSLGQVSSPSSPPSSASAGRSLAIHWHGDVIVHGQEPNDDGKRATWMAAFTEVSEQFALELGIE